MNRQIKEYLFEDLKGYGIQGEIRRITITKSYFTKRGFRATYIFRMRRYHKMALHRIRQKYWDVLDMFFNKGVTISENAEIGPGFAIPHPYGIVIGGGKIGKNCTMRIGSLIGSNFKRDAQGNEYPTLGDNVSLSPGAVVIGPISIGSDVIIGANSVVTKDVPSGSIVVGIPGRVVSKFDKNRFAK